MLRAFKEVENKAVALWQASSEEVAALITPIVEIRRLLLKPTPIPF